MGRFLLYAIPAVWARILDHGVDGYDLSSVREADTAGTLQSL